MMTNDLQDRLTRLVLRHGDDAARDCIEFALDLAECEGIKNARAQASTIIDGGLIPEPQPEIKPKSGRPGVPDAGLMAAWAAVTVVMEQQGITAHAACKWLCRPQGTRRNPKPTGVALTAESHPWSWDNPETLRDAYKTARKKRDGDEDFRTVSELCLPALRERLLRG